MIYRQITFCRSFAAALGIFRGSRHSGGTKVRRPPFLTLFFAHLKGRLTFRHPSNIAVSIAACSIGVNWDSGGSLNPGASVRDSRGSVGDSEGFNFPFRPGITFPGVNDSGILRSPRSGVGFPGVRDSGISNSVSGQVGFRLRPTRGQISHRPTLSPFQSIRDELSSESLDELLLLGTRILSSLVGSLP